MSGNCVTITVTAGTPVVVQNCSGSHICDAGCPGATTNLACINADPCVLNPCAASCPDTLLCGYCGNISTPDSMANPNSPCYVKPYTNFCKESWNDVTSSFTTTNHCRTGCPDALACGQCGNDSCAGACLSPSNCGVGCPDAEKCGMCGNLACATSPVQNACTPNSCAYGYSCNSATGMCVKNTITVTNPTVTTNSGTTNSGDFEFYYNGQEYDINLSSITNNLPLVGVVFAAVVLGVVLLKRND